MDENKEKELLDGELPENDTLTAEEKEEVSEILENLKKSKSDSENQVITDWDGLAQVGNTEEEIVAEETVAKEDDKAENSEEDEEDISDAEEDELCLNCGKRKRYTELDEDYLYCKSCREKMKKTRMNAWGVLSLIFTIVMSFIAIVWGVYAVGVSMPVIKGDKYMKEGNYRSALTCYQEAITSAENLNTEAGGTDTIFDAGKRTYAKVIDAYYNIGSLVSAQDYAKVLEEAGAFDLPRYADKKEYNEVLSGMSETCTAIQNKYQALFMQLSYATEKTDISAIEKELAELDKLKTDKEYNKYAVAYMQVYLCQFAENSEDAQIKYLLEVKEGGKAYETVWSSQLCMLYLDKGKYDEVEKICNDIIKASPESVEYYQFLMKIKIKQNDPEAALKIYEEAEKTVNGIYYSAEPLTMPYTLLTEKAVCHALLGHKEDALAAIEESFNLNLDIHSANVYVLLHYMYHVKGTEPTEEDGEKVYDAVDSGYDVVMNLFESNGLELNKKVQSAIDGKMTLEDVFVKGEAYLQ